MKKLILLFLLCGVLSPLSAQTEKKLNLKYWKDQALDTSIVINNSFKSKNTTYNLLIGYGQTLVSLDLLQIIPGVNLVQEF